jgi:hypothetical protein
MKQAGMSFTDFFWNRYSSTESTSLLFMQKMFIPSASKLLVAVDILSMGYVLQTHAKTDSTNIPADASGRSDLPDAPSASPVPQQGPQPSIPFQPPAFRVPDRGSVNPSPFRRRMCICLYVSESKKLQPVFVV